MEENVVSFRADFYLIRIDYFFMKAILGKKIGMTTLYDAEKGALNVTLIRCTPNVVRMVRTQERDGYTAVQLEADKTLKKKVRKEFRSDETPEEGTEITVDVFEVGDTVKVTGTTKAKGFQGVVKRYGFAGGPASHGHRHVLRQAGSIGSAYPQHVRKGKKMAGRMGGVQHTTKGLTVVLVDAENHIIAVKGAVPGVNGRIVSIVKD